MGQVTEPDPNLNDNKATETIVVKSGGPGVSVAGISPTKIKGACYNMTTGQMIKFPYTPDATLWNCEEEGLVVNTGDQIKIKIKVEGIGY